MKTSIHLSGAAILFGFSLYMAEAQTPIITAQPKNAAVLVGGVASFSVGVLGSGPFTYQWQFNGTNLANDIITTVAGNGTQGYAGDGGAATNGGLEAPTGVAVDASGRMYIADRDNSRIRRVGTDGIIATVAGNGTPRFSGDGGPATSANLDYPFGLAVDESGNLYIADTDNNRIRRVGTDGIITTVAGNGLPGYSGDGGPATNGQLDYPFGAALDRSGNLFIADTFNNVIRRVGTNGFITTVAGNGTAGFAGDGEVATNAELANPTGVTVDVSGNLFIADQANNRIRKVGIDGIIRTVAGNGRPGNAGDDGVATNASMNFPTSVTVGAWGSLFIADAGNNRVREVQTNGIITTVAGDGWIGYSGDSVPATNASLDFPYCVAADTAGNLFIADTFNNLIRKVFIQSPRLVLNNVGVANAGAYDLVVSGPSGSVASSLVTLQVLSPPRIVIQPPSLGVAIGRDATLNVTAAGTAPLDFQWYFDNAPLREKTNSTLLLNIPGPATAGSYNVVVTNRYGSVTSAVAVVTVGIGPGIKTQPASQTTRSDSTAIFSVVAYGDSPLAYQWRFNGKNLPINGIITTVAGDRKHGYSGDGGTATNAELANPAGVAVDLVGNIFIADASNQRVRKVGTDGIVTTVAGNGDSGYSGDGGDATNAALLNPTGVALDSCGNLFIADEGNNVVRKVGTNGIIRTVAGNGTAGYDGDGVRATSVELNTPTSVAVDATGNVFIADSYNNIVRKVGTNGIITTVAGNGTPEYFGGGGPATNAGLVNPSGVAVDFYGNLYIADDYCRIRKVGIDGIISTVAGNGTQGYAGDGGPATNAELFYPAGLAVDSSGNLYIADSSNNRIREVAANGIITTLAGDGPGRYAGNGYAATNAALWNPLAVAVDASGNVFIADSANNVIRKVVFTGGPSPELVLSNTTAGNTGSYDVVVSGPYGSITSSIVALQVLAPPTIVIQPESQAVAIGRSARFTVKATAADPLDYQWYLNGAPLNGQTKKTLLLPGAGLADAGSYDVVITNRYGSVTSAVAVLSVGVPPRLTTQPASQTNLFHSAARFSVAVSGTGPFGYQWQLNGTNLLDDLITTYAGNTKKGYTGDGGAATRAQLNDPYGVAVDALGNVFIADAVNSVIRKVGTEGSITTVAGNGTYGYSGDGGPATNATLSNPVGVAVDAVGNLFIADAYNSSIRKVGTSGIITTVAGNGTNGYVGYGGPATDAALRYPSGVAVDVPGNVFIADTGNNVIRKVGTNGTISTVAGNGTNGYSGDGGLATNAELAGPGGVLVDAFGNLFIADGNNNIVRKVDTNGIISTVAGSYSSGGGYFGDGGPATNAYFSDPAGLGLDSLGNLFIADMYNNVIRKVGTDGIISTVAGNALFGYSGDGGPAVDAELSSPSDVAVDSFGNLLIADSGNNVVRKVREIKAPSIVLTDVNGPSAGAYDVVVSTPYGSITSSIGTLHVLLPPTIGTEPRTQAVALGTDATLSVAANGTAPLDYQWWFDGAPLDRQTKTTLLLGAARSADAGSYYVVITNRYGSVTSAVAVVSVGLPPRITTQPASQTALFNSTATFSVAVSGAGPFAYQWVFNRTNRLLQSVISTVAGNGTSGYSGDGGYATNAELLDPLGIAVDGSGNVFIADVFVIRELTTNGMIFTVAGGGTNGFGDGGPATQAELANPTGVAVDASGNLFIADTDDYVIRKVGTNGIITTVAGNGTDGYAGDGGAATNAELSRPTGVAVDSFGALFISDFGNNVIRKVGTDGTITTVAGDGIMGYSGDGGPATEAQLAGFRPCFSCGVGRGGLGSYSPMGLAVAPSGDLFISDSGNNVIRKVGTDGIITTVVGNRIQGFAGDGGAATNAELNHPFALAVDPFGDLFIADTENSVIREVGTDRIISTLAGNGVGGFSGDGGAADNAALGFPSGLAVARSGAAFIADSGNARIREIAFPQSALVLNGVSGANAGKYEVVVSSPYGSVTSTVVTLVLAPQRLNVLNLEREKIQLQFQGVPGNSYILLSATNLAPPVDWRPVTTNATDPSGNWTVTVTNALRDNAVFYRMSTAGE